MKITPYNNLVIEYLKGRALNAFEPFLFFFFLLVPDAQTLLRLFFSF